MKKVVALTIALVLVCVLGVGVVAAASALSRATVGANAEIVEAGESITVVVRMDEAVPLSDDTTMIQLELNYDQDSVVYSSHNLGEDYGFMTVVISEREPVIKINWIDVAEYDMTAVDDYTPERTVRELPAGIIASITFTVNDSVDKSELVSALEDSFTASSNGNITYTFDSSVTVKVCAGHVDVNNDGKCDECGKTLALLGDANGDGLINIADAMLALQYATKVIGESQINLEASDVNGDGLVNIADAMLLLQYATKVITEFPVN